MDIRPVSVLRRYVGGDFKPQTFHRETESREDTVEKTPKAQAMQAGVKSHVICIPDLVRQVLRQDKCLRTNNHELLKEYNVKGLCVARP